MKYKIGDLVELSAAGRKNNHNPRFSRSGFGVITDYCMYDKFPIHTKWFTPDGKMKSFSAKQYEIKKLKPTKPNKNKKNS
tara:strand:+ start:9115 stop:9354 length:240 start_codon:yes stop_codon:yes gene_type:complete